MGGYKYGNQVGGGSSGVDTVARAQLAEKAPKKKTDTWVDVKEDFGAKGDGVTDDTTAIQNAFNSLNITGGEVRFPGGTYLISGAGITLASNVRIVGVNNKKSIVKAGNMSLDSSMFNGANRANITIESIGFDGNSNLNVRHGLYVSGNNIDKNLRVFNCSFINFKKTNSRAIYTWQSRSVWIRGNEFIDCVIPLYIDSPDNNVFIEDNKITSPSSIMVNGIFCSAGSDGSRPVYVAGNHVDGARVDATGNGVDGHGIKIYRCQGSKVIGNIASNCATSGILVGSGSWDSTVQGNSCTTSKTGIYVEVSPNDITVGTNVSRGAVVIGNSSYNNDQGIAVSYSPASIISENIVHDSQGRGIVNDSNKVNISKNTVYNSYKNPASTNPQFASGAGIESYGTDCIVANNICFDNQTTKSQSYGIAVTDTFHVVSGNILKGNLVGGLYLGGTTTSIKVNNIE